MNATETIQSRIKAFKVSSSFTGGDPQSFSVKLSDEVRLPGKFDPDDYVGRLGTAFADKNVLVVCPGNGGLCVAALRAGASTVVAVEPRSIYNRALAAVSDFTSEVIGASFSSRRPDDKLFEKFDVIFWTEGLDEVQHPKALFEAAIAALAPGGRFFLELAHGRHGVLPESINSWRPSKAAFKETLDGYPSLDLVNQLSGRDQIRVIYELQNNGSGPAQALVQKSEAVDEDVAYFRKNLFGALKVPESYMAETQEEKVETLDAAVNDMVEHTKAMVEAGHLPTKVDPDAPRHIHIDMAKTAGPRETTAAQRLAEQIKGIIPTEAPVHDNLDSIYEGRASTPKSKSNKTVAERKSKKKKKSDNSKP